MEECSSHFDLHLFHFPLLCVRQNMAVQVHGNSELAVTQEDFQSLGIAALFDEAGGESVSQCMQGEVIDGLAAGGKFPQNGLQVKVGRSVVQEFAALRKKDRAVWRYRAASEEKQYSVR